MDGWVAGWMTVIPCHFEDRHAGKKKNQGGKEGGKGSISLEPRWGSIQLNINRLFNRVVLVVWDTL